ncbi:MAG: hypothetical protein HDS71_09075 [Bacteroidales bacterium]|nr:hypothetical protein [Bacteroidales bacterium]
MNISLIENCMSWRNVDDDVGTWRATSEPCGDVLFMVIPQTWHATSLHSSGNGDRLSSGNESQRPSGNEP